MVLVLYGALSLWLGRPYPASDARKTAVCQFWLCTPVKNESPKAVNPPQDEALPIARQQLILDAASAYRWADLAESEIDADDVERGRFAIRQALAAAPGNPAILFRAATLYLRLEDYPQTLRQLTAVLRNPELASFDDRAFTLYSQMDLPLDELLDQGVPLRPQTANAFLRFWISQGKLEEARETWTWINRNRLTNLQSAGFYVALLKSESRWDEAFASWTKVTERLSPDYGRTNFVFDGSFERRRVECPFDWQLQSSETAAVSRDPEIAYRGTASLRIDFSGAPKGKPFASQLTMLQPGRWQLKAMMKTQLLTGNQGVVIRVLDEQNGDRLNVSTDSFEGTKDWTVIGKTFAVGQETRIARVEIVRPDSLKSDTPVNGIVWLDNVVLEPLDKREGGQLAEAGAGLRSAVARRGDE